MRSHIYIRPLNINDQSEVGEFVRWVEDSGRFFPKNALTLPSTRIMVAEKVTPDSKEILLYQPHYVSLSLGSYVSRGEISESETASALHQMTAAAFTRCHQEGLADILMLSEHPDTIAFALRHSYQEAHKAFRLEPR